MRKAGGLVKLLALAPGHRLHREQVMNLLWPNHEAEAAANNLYRSLHFARRVLEACPRPCWPWLQRQSLPRRLSLAQTAGSPSIATGTATTRSSV